MKGVINLYKEKGLSSAACVSKARKILRERAIGHMGTLDPQGTGVLLLGVGKGTRLFDYYLGKDKVYEADFEFGYTTDTLDADGSVTDKTDSVPSREEIETALPSFVGEISQLPPVFSAKSVGGVRAYDIARSGGVPELKPSAVKIYSFELVKRLYRSAYRFRIHCSSGTYIRSLCRDLAVKLNSLACMTAICRTRSGSFTSGDSFTLEKLSEAGERCIIPLETALASVPRRDFDGGLYQKISNGVKIETAAAEEQFTVYCRGELFGLGEAKDGRLRIVTYLKD